MKSGFVLYTSEDYFEMAKVTADSILEFSSKPIEIFCINSEPKDFFKHDRINPRSLNVEIPKNPGTNPFFYVKELACSLSDFDAALYLDTDALVTPYIDNFWEDHVTEENLKLNYILGSMHGPLPYTAEFPPEIEVTQADPRFPADCRRQCLAKKDNIARISKEMGVENPNIQIPLVHAASFFFSNNSKQFLKETYDWSQKLLPGCEEELINAILCKYNANRCLPCITPGRELLDSFLDGSLNQEKIDEWLGYGWKQDNKPDYEIYASKTNSNIEFYLFHGLKNLEENKEYLQKLKLYKKTYLLDK